MRHLKPIITLAATLGLATPQATVAQRTAVDTLAWLAGCWKLAGGTTTVDEQWMVPNGGAMLGVSRTVTGGRVREFEFLRIYAAGDTLVYAANPSGQAPTEFRSTSLGGSEITFENRAHDFPQRIRYRLASPEVLVATIDGDRDNRRQPVVFSYARSACGTDRAQTAGSATPSASAQTVATVRAALQPKYDTAAARENASLGGTYGWFAENADASFAHLMWTAGGQAVPVARGDVLAGASERMRLANTATPLKNRRFTHTIEKILLRGDTAEVLLSSRHVGFLVDTAGRYGERGAEVERSGTERRLDRWVRAGSDWRLRQVAIIGQEITMGGRLVTKDGKPAP